MNIRRENIEDETKAILESINKIPPFPAVTNKILTLVRSEDYSAKDIADVVQLDQVISSLCLKICNSAYFGLKQKVNSVQQAVVFMGSDAIVKTVLTVTSGNVQSALECKNRGLWIHSVSCALMSMILLNKFRTKGKLDESFKPSDEYLLYTVSLVHDIGRLVLEQFINKDFDRVEILQSHGIYNLLEIENQLFGINHAKLGAIIANKWGFPDDLVEPIRNHHKEINMEVSTGGANLTEILILANSIVNLYLIYDKNVIVDIHPNLMARFDLTPNDMAEIRYALFQELSKADEILSLEDS